jgi:hypothetical protein
MIAIVDALGWSYGLPDEPQDPDYINILAGNREFRFEAEDIYDKDRDNVSVMSFVNFGDFSGKGWLHNATGKSGKTASKMNKQQGNHRQQPKKALSPLAFG